MPKHTYQHDTWAILKERVDYYKKLAEEYKHKLAEVQAVAAELALDNERLKKYIEYAPIIKEEKYDYGDLDNHPGF